MLEKLVTLAYECERYISDRNSDVLFGDNKQTHRSPLDEMRMLISLYFEDLNKPKLAIQQSLFKCNSAINEQFAKKCKDLQTWLDDEGKANVFNEDYGMLLIDIDKFSDAVKDKLNKIKRG